MTHKHPFMIGSEWREATHTLPVINPYNQEVFAEVNLAGTAEREGLKYSIEEMTKIKLLVMNHYLD